MMERQAIEEGIWVECVGRVRELEEALCHATEHTRHTETLEKELLEVGGSLKKSKTLAKG